MEISKNGYSFFIDRMNIETDKELIQRSWFIVNQLNDMDDGNFVLKFQKAEKLSRLWHNIKNLQCKYHKSYFYKLNFYNNFYDLIMVN